MNHPMLRLFDGMDGTSPELHDEVQALQKLLVQDGLSLTVDGSFGPDTESALKQFQSEQGLIDDGIAGPLTWAALTSAVPPDPGKVLPTTLPPGDAGLLAQLDQAARYRSSVERAAAPAGLPTALLAGIGSRESKWGLALRPSGPSGTGDFAPRRYPTQFRTGPLPPDGAGFGRGLMQVDYDAQDFARTGNWQDPDLNIRTGYLILAGYRDLVQRKTGLEGTALLRAAIAAYNSGPGNVLRALQDGRDVDFYTAGRNYSSDVLNRAGWFQLHGWT